MAPANRRSLMCVSLQQPSVWKCAAMPGLSIGLLQAAISHDDHWISHAVSSAVLIKTIISPLITFSVVLASAAGAWMNEYFAN